MAANANTAPIQWNPAWNLGIGVIDYDHQMLVNVTNMIFDCVNRPDRSNGSLMRALKAFEDQLERHFRREEALFTASDYPGAAEHCRRHRELEKVFRDLLGFLNREPDMARLEEICLFLRRWLINHMVKHDRTYVPYLKTERPRLAG